jgi:hypothetical protein
MTSAKSIGWHGISRPVPWKSAQQVHETAGALGVANPDGLRQRITDLTGLFTARNQVAHELDLQQPVRRGDRTRRSRSRDETIGLCAGGFQTGQLIVNAVGELLHR